MSSANAVSNTSNILSNGYAIHTREGLAMRAVEICLAKYAGKNMPASEILVDEWIVEVTKQIEFANALRPRSQKMKMYTYVPGFVIAELILAQGDVCRISFSGSVEDATVAVYNHRGPRNGLYTLITDTKHYGVLGEIMRQYSPGITQKERNELWDVLLQKAPLKSLTRDRNLVNVGNGIWDMEKRQLYPYNRDYIAISKVMTNLNLVAKKPVIIMPDGVPWDVDSWFASLSDSPEQANFFWEITQALCRPNVRYNQNIFLYSEKGNNGKGTLCAMWDALIGDEFVAHVALDDFEKDFFLTPLVGKTANIAHESDTDGVIGKSAKYKALTTGDVISLTRKFCDNSSFNFYGLMVFCLNSWPKFKDTSGGRERREIIVPMSKCFTGAERKYIKADYLQRTEVLEYILKKVLVDMPSIEKFNLPPSSLEAEKEYKRATSSVEDFWSEVVPQLTWDMVPFSFLLDLYRAWYDSVNGKNGYPLGKIKFYEVIRKIVEESDEWECSSKRSKYKTGDMMDYPEPLILDYDLQNWMNPKYNGKDPDMVCIPATRVSYEGIRRKTRRYGQVDGDSGYNLIDCDDNTAGAANT